MRVSTSCCRFACVLAAIGIILAACSPAAPLPTTYVLGPAPKAADSVEPLVGRPVLLVRSVLVPDYLDVSDIMVRRADNSVMPSATGRWGERLSVGATRALALGLQQRLPGLVVTRDAPMDRATMEVRVDVETFEAQADGTVIFAARWQAADGHGILAAERVAVTEPSTGSADAAVSAGMTRALDDLSARIATSIRVALAGRRSA